MFQFGWWALPAFITAAAVYIAHKRAPQPRGDYDFGAVFIGLMSFAVAVIVSLVAWLAWALLA